MTRGNADGGGASLPREVFDSATDRRGGAQLEANVLSKVQWAPRASCLLVVRY